MEILRKKRFIQLSSLTCEYSVSKTVNAKVNCQWLVANVFIILEDFLSDCILLL